MSTQSPAIQSAAPHDIAQDKIKFWEKISYALATMSVGPLLNLTNGYLMIFYTDIVGLSPIAIGTLFLIARIADGLSDPIMGYVLDRIPRMRMGKFRPLLIVGGIICSLNFLLMWFGPVWSTTGKLAVAYISYLLIGITYDVMDISKNSLLPAMTANPKERSSLGAINAFFGILGSTIIAVLAPTILAAGNSSLASFSTLILMVTGMVFLFSLLGGLGIKERVTPVADAETKYSLKDYLNIFTQKPVFMYLIFAFMFATGYYLYGAVNAYFFTYVMKDLAALGTVSLILLVGLLPGIFLGGFVSKKLGKKRSLVFASLMMAAAFMIRWIDPTSMTLIYIATIAAGLSFGLFMPVSVVLQADLIDYIEYKLNYRSESAVSSISSFISKTGNGVAGAIPGFALGLTGYIAGSQQQPASAITAITVLSVGVPVVFFVVGALLFGFGFNLDKNTMQEVEDTLSERRTAKLAQ